MIDLEITGAERGHLDDAGRDPAEENRYAALEVERGAQLWSLRRRVSQ